MSTNSLEIFKQLFTKTPKDIKKILFLISPYIEEQNYTIAAFLAVEHPIIIWLIHLLHNKYNKQFLNNKNLQQYVIENIARSITLITDETGILNYSQQDQNNIILNTLFTHLTPDVPLEFSETEDKEDVILVISSNQDMDFLYQNDTSFFKLPYRHTLSMQHLSKATSTPVFKAHNINLHHNNEILNKLNTTSSNQLQTQQLDVTVIQNQIHVMPLNTNDISSVAH